MIRCDTAMILAAGLGRRMHLAEDDPPKPLTIVKGRALLDYLLIKLEIVGIMRVVVNVHCKGEKIKAHLKNYKGNMEIVISDETTQLMNTGGGVMKARHLLGDNPFLICNSDILWQEEILNIASLIQHYNTDNMDILLLLAAQNHVTGYDGQGDFILLKDGTIHKCQTGHRDAFMYTGVQIVHPSLLKNTPDMPFSFHVFWDRVRENNRLYGHVFQGTWMHVGTAEGLALAEKSFKSSSM